jgi:DNA-binding MarR family transcriptional regulator
MKNSSIYLRFIQLVKVLESAQPLAALAPIEHQLLEIIAIANTKQERLSVKDLMADSEVASPATIHKHIHSMVDKGWIYLAPTEDARRKQLMLTDATMKYFDKLGVAITKAVSHKKK